MAKRDLGVLMLTMALLVGFTATADAATILVPTDQATVQDAIDSATTGDTILLIQDATGYFSVPIDKPGLTLGSQGGPWTYTWGNNDGSWTWTNVVHADMKIQDLNFVRLNKSGDPTWEIGTHAFDVSDGAHLELVNCDVDMVGANNVCRNFDNGVFSATDCAFVDGSTGVKLWASATVNMTTCTIDGFDTGLYFSADDAVGNISNVDILDSTTAVKVDTGNNPVVNMQECTVQGFDHTVTIVGVDNVSANFSQCDFMPLSADAQAMDVTGTDQIAMSFDTCDFVASGTGHTSHGLVMAAMTNFDLDFQGCHFEWYSGRAVKAGEDSATGTFVFNNCSFDGGTDPSFWMSRGIYISGPVNTSATMTNCTVTGSNAEGINFNLDNRGIAGHTLVCQNCEVDNFTAKGFQAYKVYNTDILVKDCTVTNYTGGDGGVRFQQCYGSTITALNNYIAGNPDGDAYGIYFRKYHTEDGDGPITAVIDNCQIENMPEGIGIRFRDIRESAEVPGEHSWTVQNCSFDGVRYPLGSSSDQFTNQTVNVDNITVTNCDAVIYNGLGDEDDVDFPSSSYNVTNSNVSLTTANSYGFFFMDGDGAVAVNASDCTVNGGVFASLNGANERNVMNLTNCDFTTPAGQPAAIYAGEGIAESGLYLTADNCNFSGAGNDFVQVNSSRPLEVTATVTTWEDYARVLVLSATASSAVISDSTFTNNTDVDIQDNANDTTLVLNGVWFTPDAGLDVATPGTTGNWYSISATNCNVAANSSEFTGKGLGNAVNLTGLDNFTLWMGGCTIQPGSGTHGIYVSDATHGLDLSIENCQILSTTTSIEGNGFRLDDEVAMVDGYVVNLDGCTFDWRNDRMCQFKNSLNGQITINNCSFDGGTEPAYWPSRGIYMSGPVATSATVTNCDFTGTNAESLNVSINNRGVAGHTLVCENCQVDNFSAKGIQAYKTYNTDILVKDCDVTNYTGGDGGVRFQQCYGSTINIQNTYIAGNPDSDAYGIYFRKYHTEDGDGPITAVIDNCQIENMPEGIGIRFRDIRESVEVPGEHSWTVQNCSFDGVSYPLGSSSDQFTNQTVNVDNITVTNCDAVIYNNLGDEDDVDFPSSSYNVTNSNVSLTTANSYGFFFMDGDGAVAVNASDCTVNGGVFASLNGANERNVMNLTNCSFTTPAVQQAAVFTAEGIAESGLYLTTDHCDFVGSGNDFTMANSSRPMEVTATYTTWMGYEDGISIYEGTIDADQCDFVDMATVVVVAATGSLKVYDSNFVLYDNLAAAGTDPVALDVDYCFFADDAGTAEVGANSIAEDITGLGDVYVTTNATLPEYLQVLEGTSPAMLNSTGTPVYSGAKGVGQPLAIRNWSLY